MAWNKRVKGGEIPFFFGTYHILLEIIHLELANPNVLIGRFIPTSDSNDVAVFLFGDIIMNSETVARSDSVSNGFAREEDVDVRHCRLLVIGYWKQHLWELVSRVEMMGHYKSCQRQNCATNAT